MTSSRPASLSHAPSSSPRWTPRTRHASRSMGVPSSSRQARPRWWGLGRTLAAVNEATLQAFLRETDDLDKRVPAIGRPSLLSTSGAASGSSYATFNDAMDADADDCKWDTASLRTSVSRMAHFEGTTPAQTVMAIFKAWVGSGVLFLPKAFYNGGWAFSAVAMPVLCGLNVAGMLLLLHVHDHVAASWHAARRSTSTSAGRPCKAGSMPRLTFEQLASMAGGRTLALIIDASVVLSQLGFCCVYTAFIAQNLTRALSTLTNGQVVLSEQTIALAQAGLYVPLSWLRHMRFLSITNLLGAGLVIFGLAFVLAKCFSRIEAQGGAAPPFWEQPFNRSDFALLLGTICYSFEGNGLILPMARATGPRARPRFARILAASCAGICALYLCFAFAGYAAFGSQIAASVTLNLTDTDGALVQAAFCLALVCTFPLQLFPAVAILERRFAFPRDAKAGGCGCGCSPRRRSRFSTQRSAAISAIRMSTSSRATLHLDSIDEDGRRRGGGGGAGRRHAALLSNDAPNNNNDDDDHDDDDDFATDEESGCCCCFLPGYWLRNLFRLSLVGGVVALALVAECELDGTVSLIGGLCCVPLGFIYPCILYWALVLPDQLKARLKAGAQADAHARGAAAAGRRREALDSTASGMSSVSTEPLVSGRHHPHRKDDGQDEDGFSASHPQLTCCSACGALARSDCSTLCLFVSTLLLFAAGIAATVLSTVTSIDRWSPQCGGGGR